MSGLAASLQPSINQLLSHPLLGRIEAADLKTGQLAAFACQYYFYCDAFPRLLAAVAANVPDDETRLNLIVNLWEEHGEGDLTKSHRALFKAYLRGLGVTDEYIANAAPCEGVSSYIDKCVSICKNAHFLEAMAFLGPGAEMFTSQQYEKIVRGLKRYTTLSPAHIEFWVVHIDGDDHHYAIMASALERWAVSDENRSRISSGAHKAVALEYEFWNAMQGEIERL